MRRASIKLAPVLALTSFALFSTSAFAQSSATGPNNADKPIVARADSRRASSEPKPDITKNKVGADEPKSNELKDEIESVKAENAVVRELLRKMEEQQCVLLKQVERMERRLNGGTTTDVSTALKPIVTPTTADASVSVATPEDAAPNNAQPVADSATTSAPPVQETTSVIEMESSSGRRPRTQGCRSCGGSTTIPSSDIS